MSGVGVERAWAALSCIALAFLWSRVGYTLGCSGSPQEQVPALRVEKAPSGSGQAGCMVLGAGVEVGHRASRDLHSLQGSGARSCDAWSQWTGEEA